MNRIRPTGNKGTCIAALFRPGLVTVFALGITALVTLAATHDAGAAGGATALARHEPVALSPDAAIGARAFTDPSLSASGKQSCASCHAPETAHAAPNALPVQPGGADLTLRGLRNSQPLRYLATNKAFQVDASGKPSGGFFWDGRANSLAAQAGQPLLGANEMANKDKASVVAKVAQAQWAGEFTALYGEGVLQDVDLAFAKLTHALERFQLEDVQFNAYTSKYDAVLRRQARLTAQEKRGLILFNAPRKGNCAACHPSSKQPDGSHPVFTDFSYDNLGVPRNLEILRNEDAKYFDLGLCARDDLKKRLDLCGAFRVPSLRNVTQRQAFFHNGKFKTLEQAVTFYFQRDTHPEKWYPRNADGSVRKFDDLPLRYRGNVNSAEGPYDRKRGQRPALNRAEIDDLIAFLDTLTDGWSDPPVAQARLHADSPRATPAQRSGEFKSN